jgi:hypothetical protein
MHIGLIEEGAGPTGPALSLSLDRFRKEGVMLIYRERIRRLGFVTSLSLIPAAILAMDSQVAWAHTPPFGDSGIGITCAITGSVTFAPPLKDGATGMSHVTTRDRLRQCSGAVSQFGRTLTGGVQKNDGEEDVPTNCTSLLTSGMAPAFTEKTSYLPRQPNRVPSTTTAWATGSAVLNSTYDKLIVSYTNATSVTGSFSTGTGPAPSLTEVFDQTVNTLIEDCETSGIKKLNFSEADGPVSSVTIG